MRSSPGRSVVADGASGARSRHPDVAWDLRHAGYGSIFWRQPQSLAAIGAVHDTLPPRRVVEVPSNGPTKAIFETVARLPSEFLANLAAVDRITRIVTRPIRYKLDQLLVGAIGTAG